MGYIQLKGKLHQFFPQVQTLAARAARHCLGPFLCYGIYTTQRKATSDFTTGIDISSDALFGSFSVL